MLFCVCFFVARAFHGVSWSCWFVSLCLWCFFLGFSLGFRGVRVFVFNVSVGWFLL